MKCNFKKVETHYMYNSADRYMGDNKLKICLLKKSNHNECDGEKKCIIFLSAKYIKEV